MCGYESSRALAGIGLFVMIRTEEPIKCSCDTSVFLRGAERGAALDGTAGAWNDRV